VTVKGARIVQKVDGLWIYPTKQQIAASPNGYSLLAKLTLPHIRVDEAMNSITALTNLGTVQVRINDIVATREDLQTLDMQGIEHIEFIDNPDIFGFTEDTVARIINKKTCFPFDFRTLIRIFTASFRNFVVVFVLFFNVYV
jgi:hypothetical protein